MPANLNALIRYQTIDRCLKGGRRRYSVKELIDECSDALGEARGRYKPISERTIRDDLRIMRSDILGFNAPIIQEKGKYYYSDADYSIHGSEIVDSELAGRILMLLIDLRKQIKHPDLETIIGLVGKLTKREYVKEISNEFSESYPIERRSFRVKGDYTLSKIEFNTENFDLNGNTLSYPLESGEEQKIHRKEKIDWVEIFNLINRIQLTTSNKSKE